MHAEFLAAAQVLIYVGAVSILMMFAIMLTSNLAGQRIAQVNQHAVTGAFICLFFVAVASLLIGATDIWRLSANALPLKNTFVIGKLLLTEFMLPVRIDLGPARGRADRRHRPGKRGEGLMQYYLILAAILFAIGLFGVITRRNTIGILMSLELMFNAANINFVAFNKFVATAGMSGQIFAIFIVAMAAAEATVGLAIVLLVYRNWRGVDSDNFSVMKW